MLDGRWTRSDRWYVSRLTNPSRRNWVEGEHLTRSSTWLKTTDNCYVSETGLVDSANKDILDNCGPIGFIQLNDTNFRKRESLPAPVPITPPATGVDLGSQYLVNLTVGEDFARCYSCPNTTSCDEVTKYPFGHEVFVQCYYDATEANNGTYQDWYETTDFCYVREQDFFQSLYDRKSSVLSDWLMDCWQRMNSI